MEYEFYCYDEPYKSYNDSVKFKIDFDSDKEAVMHGINCGYMHTEIWRKDTGNFVDNYRVARW